MPSPRFSKRHNALSRALAIALSSLFLAACGDKTASADKHTAATTPTEKSAEGHGKGDAGHADHGPSGEKITHLSDKSELFVEFPALVVGQPATFVSHFTWLANFKPVTQGQLTLILSGGAPNSPEERFSVEAPSVPGIFKPTITPKVSGERELTLLVKTDQGVLTHELGPVSVFADAKAAAANHTEPSTEGIAFSKEQQWKIDFAISEVVAGRISDTINATGVIKATPDGEALLPAPAAGVVRAAGTFPRIGQLVKKGQILAVLAPRLGGDTDQATLDANASKTRVALELTRRERERMETLFKDEAIPEKRLIEARANEKMAEAEFRAGQARAGQLSSGAGGIALRSPIDGVLADVSVASGAFVAEGAPLFHVADTRRLWLEARVPESNLGRLGTPNGVRFSVEGFEPTFTVDIDTTAQTKTDRKTQNKPGDPNTNQNGRLVAIGGVVDPATRTVPAIVEFTNPGGALRLGMSAKVQLLTGALKDTLLIPASAVQDESGTQVVYVQTGGESFERRLVQTGPRNGDRIAITAGLEAGQRIVSQGAYLIRLSTSKAGPAGHAH